ncbi:hypothetical protein ACKKBG_A07560 [Auxenochlorella protothecoides x Auxenochlorella symbiontica]|uniref:Putative RNA-binding protein EIF1AD n=3 Tax=Auxenochlorella protothecoides TaxID=3075 RepID=A0A087SN47_AUXPR|nr:putative RNA-binding protein EIF1AD [Auxenochlorella protothecoides]KFM27151.1 putative RNA-binding protein EIF1AD [Auxenochlorella protothecoides]
MEVEFPCGRRTLCLIPARFHKKLWIKNGNFLIVEEVEAIDAAVSGQIVKVLYADHVKQLQRIPGVWPEEFRAAGSPAVPDNPSMEQEKREAREPGCLDGSSSEDDGLPPLERINNRRVVEYLVSESDSE